MEGYEERAEALLEEPYWIIDVLPWQVPAGSPGQYFAVESRFLREPHVGRILEARARFLLKLNCYRSLCVEGEDDPDPEKTEGLVRNCPVRILTGDALLTSDPQDTYMTLYHPDEELLELVRALAASEGLFVWQPGRTLS